MQAVAQELYADKGADAQAGGGAAAADAGASADAGAQDAQNDGVVDADYTMVDDDKK